MNVCMVAAASGERSRPAADIRAATTAWEYRCGVARPVRAGCRSTGSTSTSKSKACTQRTKQRTTLSSCACQVGIALGLEVSSPARNNADWHRLLEICAMSGTLICDEDGLYDPTDCSDRLLSGSRAP